MDYATPSATAGTAETPPAPDCPRHRAHPPSPGRAPASRRGSRTRRPHSSRATCSTAARRSLVTTRAAGTRRQIGASLLAAARCWAAARAARLGPARLRRLGCWSWAVVCCKETGDDLPHLSLRERACWWRGVYRTPEARFRRPSERPGAQGRGSALAAAAAPVASYPCCPCRPCCCRSCRPWDYYCYCLLRIVGAHGRGREVRPATSFQAVPGGLALRARLRRPGTARCSACCALHDEGVRQQQASWVARRSSPAVEVETAAHSSHAPSFGAGASGPGGGTAPRGRASPCHGPCHGGPSASKRYYCDLRNGLFAHIPRFVLSDSSVLHSA